MKRLPSIRRLEKVVLSTAKGSGTIHDSLDFVTQHRDVLASYESVEHFATAPDTDPALRIRRGCEHHLRIIRAQLARELWSRGLFIGVTVIDDLLFYAVARGTESNPVRRVLEMIRDHRLHHPGMMVIPVHSFGVLAAGFFQWAASSRVEFASAEFGFAISPQTNSIEHTMGFLSRVQQIFEIAQTVPCELIEHWFRSRPIKWLTQNPLLVVKTQSFPGSYYENQFLLLTKLRMVTTLVSMLAALQPLHGMDSKERLVSSSMVNNFQTLDIRHYIVLFNASSPHRELTGHCVPMHLQTPALAEISDLGIEFNPRYWKRHNSTSSRIHAATSIILEGYLKHSFGSKGDDIKGRVYRKIYESLIFFRRSFLRSDDGWLSTISLAIAFEMLLTDNYANGVNERIVRRVGLLLRGVAGVRRWVKTVEELYRARGGIVHSGTSNLKVDLHLARQAYIHTFLRLTEKLQTTRIQSPNPIKNLCGDTAN